MPGGNARATGFAPCFPATAVPGRYLPGAACLGGFGRIKSNPLEAAGLFPRNSVTSQQATLIPITNSLPRHVGELIGLPCPAGLKVVHRKSGGV